MNKSSNVNFTGTTTSEPKNFLCKKQQLTPKYEQADLWTNVNFTGTTTSEPKNFLCKKKKKLTPKYEQADLNVNKLLETENRLKGQNKWTPICDFV